MSLVLGMIKVELKTIAVVAPNFPDATHASFLKSLFALGERDDIDCVPVDFEAEDHADSPFERQRRTFLRLLDSAASCTQDVVLIIDRPTQIGSGVRTSLIGALKALPDNWRYVKVGASSIATRPCRVQELYDMLDRLPTVFSDAEWLHHLKSPLDHELKDFVFTEDPSHEREVGGFKHSPLAKKTLQLTTHIPWVMFRTGPWSRARLPPAINIYLKAFEKLNPQVKQIYLDDEDAESFMQEHYPEYIKHYTSLIPGAYRADVLRLCLLMKHGGFYSDIGHLHKRPLSEICSSHADVFLVAEPFPTKCGVYNAFMGAKRRDPLIVRFFQKVMSNVARRKYSDHFLGITGPQALGQVLHGMLGLTCKTPTPAGIQVMSDHRTAYLLRNHYSPAKSRNVIVHEKDTADILIETKFPDYYNYIYQSRNKIHYQELWKKRRVYSDA